MTSDPTPARVQIQYTMAVYCNCVDSGDVEGVVSCFTEAGQLELSSGAKANGRAAIRAFYTPVIGPERPDRGPDGALFAGEGGHDSDEARDSAAAKHRGNALHRQANGTAHRAGRLGANTGGLS